MPHQCTNCGRAFDDGSKEMLSGCPDCGGNKFQFRPDGVEPSADPPADDAEPPDPPESPAPDSRVARTVGKTATTVRDLVGSSPDPVDDESPPAAPEPDPSRDTPAESTTAAEDAAQASARSEIVTGDELPAGPTSDSHRFRPVRTDSDAEAAGEETPRTDDVIEEPDTGDRPDLSELREELNDQFESIKVVEPGQYELNLMELYDREEYIIALQEDGRYSIQVPETIRE